MPRRWERQATVDQETQTPGDIQREIRSAYEAERRFLQLGDSEYQRVAREALEIVLRRSRTHVTPRGLTVVQTLRARAHWRSAVRTITSLLRRRTRWARLGRFLNQPNLLDLWSGLTRDRGRLVRTHEAGIRLGVPPPPPYPRQRDRAIQAPPIPKKAPPAYPPFGR